MTATGGTRRLAAILAADVVGYSRLMAVDEAGTLEWFKLLRADHIEPAVRRFNGRVVGEAGDSLLVEFFTASEAVTCAVEVQETLARLNAELPDDRRMQFRMGVNLGEVIVDGATIHGDGVNVAARLEKLAEPGGIVVAHAVREQAKGRVSCAFDDLGEKTLHNIAEPVRAYVVATGRSEGAGQRAAASEARDTRTTIAVLPFTNMSGDPAQDYFADGITEDLITALSKFRRFAVTARNSTFVYKGRAVKVEDVGRELRVHYVVEGSVRKAGTRIRATVQLIDAETGAHAWAERFDRDLHDIFVVQDEIVTAIAGRLSSNVVAAEVSRRRSLGPESVTSWDHLMRGWAAWRREAEVEAHGHFVAATEADPASPLASSTLGFFYGEVCFTQTLGLSEEECWARARKLCEQALSRNDGDPAVHYLLGSAFINFDLDQAKYHLEQAVKLNPFEPENTINLGVTIAFMGRHAEGLALIESAFSNEPRRSLSERSVIFFVHFLMRAYEVAIEDFRALEDPSPEKYLILAACHAQLGHADDVRAAVAAFEARKPKGFDVARLLRCWRNVLRQPEDKEHWTESFRKAGLVA
jgi:adenylate cyclase